MAKKSNDNSFDDLVNTNKELIHALNNSSQSFSTLLPTLTSKLTDIGKSLDSFSASIKKTASQFSSGDKGKNNTADISKTIEMLGKSSGTKAAAGEELAMLALNTGGSTTESRFVVGEGKGKDKDTAEIIENPTGAPIKVTPVSSLNNDLATSLMQNLKGFAGGTERLAMQIAGNLPFQQGSFSSDFANMAASGGKAEGTSKGVIDAIGQSVTTLVGMIPEVGPILQVFTAGLTSAAKSAVDITERFNDLSRQLAPYSAQLSAAVYTSEAKQTMTDVEMADLYGEPLSELYEKSYDLWLEIQKLLMAIASPMIEILIPAIKETTEFIKNILPTIQEAMLGTSALIRAFVDVMLSGDFTLDNISKAIAKGMMEAVRRNMDSKNINPLVEQVLQTGNQVFVRNQPAFAFEGVGG